jgi:hypothetical protein
MISIIICSKYADISESLKSNIKNTIGIPYELVVINNSKNEYTIFEAYNEGVKRASFDLLCFMHEDIWYHSQHWGKSVISHLSDVKTGLIGLAGSFYLLPFPSSWFYAEPAYLNLIQAYPSSSGEIITKHRKVYGGDKEAICVDGFWFCSRKDVFKEVSFDTDTYHGFHFYDMDISMQIHQQGYRIYIVTDITVAHHSTGSQNKQWIESAYIFYNKWKNQLPISVASDLKIRTFNNLRAFKNLLYIHKLVGYPVSKETFKIGWNRIKLNVLTAYLYYIVSRIKNRDKPIKL